ncbi:hypothetical protein GCM10023320_79270 [Pseudonocardia adelaidensis]|uniref:Serine/threonine protein kinase n=1 Tax=Pseudonocardia adelaidensis TaxID=648754 RepID=A0ABP9P522_9PSEU
MGGDVMAATRRALAPGGSRPPAMLVLLAALLVAATIVAAVVGTLSLTGGAGPGGPPPARVAAPPELATPPAAPPAVPTEAAPTAAPTAEAPAPPADPRSVFRDPALRTLAEPFLTGPAASCDQRDPGADVTETVACDLGGGRSAVFSRMVSPEAMRDHRRGIVAGRDARAGTVRSVRWRYVAGRPETRAGVPPLEKDRGEGIRVRFVDRAGVPRLYFDQDSSGCTGDIALTRPTGNDRADLEALRTYWADPAE